MTIPTTLRVPFMYVEFDPSRAFQGPSILSYKVLCIGQRTSAGIRAKELKTLVTSADQAAQYFGVGSQIHRMAIAWFANNKFTPLYVIALDDSGTGVAATGTIVFTGPATAAGTLYLWVDGYPIQVAVTNTMAASALATAVSAAINAVTSLPVTATVDAATVTLTAKNDGTPGNDIDVRCNYLEGEVFPAGIGATVTAMASGANDVDISDALDLIGNDWYNIIFAPYTDNTNIALVETELSSRFSYLHMQDILYISAKRGTGVDKAAKLTALSSFGNARNSAHVSVIHSTGMPNWSMEVAAMYAGQIAAEGSTDPARPLQTLPLEGALAPVMADQFTIAENNVLLFDGVSTFSVDNTGKVRIQRAITMYQTNTAGAADTAYLDVETMLTLMYMRYDFRNTFATKYPRAKLADDGIRVGPGQQIITPSIAKAEAVSIFRGWEFLGLAENIDQFKNDLVVTRSIQDPNRLDFIVPPDLVNQFRIGAATIQFLLQSPTITA